MYKISGTVFPELFCAVKGGWPFIARGGVTFTTWDVAPTVLKSDVGIFVIWANVVGSIGENAPLPPAELGPPLATLMMTRVATMTTTSPIESHVKSPAGRPLEAFAGGRVGVRLAAWVAGRLDATFFFDAGDLATMLLGALRTTNLVDAAMKPTSGPALSSFHYGRNFESPSGRDRHHGA